MGNMKSVPMYNENQVGGVLSIYTDNTQKTGPITGAGVMLIENYFGKASVILIRNIHTNMYEIPGGTIDQLSSGQHETPEVAAFRELKEETLGLFTLNSVKCMPYTSSSYINTQRPSSGILQTKWYKIFILYISGPNNIIEGKNYYKNKNIIDSYLKAHPTQRGLFSGYTETDNFIRVYLDDFYKNGGMSAQGDFNTTDARGNIIKICGRDKKCIREAIKSSIISSSNLYFPTKGILQLSYTPSVTASHTNSVILIGTTRYFI